MGTLRKIYILHGWAYSTENWDNFITALKDKELEPILLKIPGLTEKSNEVWDLNKYVSWLKNKLAKEKGKIILLGHSNGGRITSSFSQKYPKKVHKLILIDSAGVYHQEFPIRLKRLLFKSAAKLGKRFTSSNKLRDLLYKAAREKDYKEAGEIAHQTMINLSSTNLISTFQNIEVPTLIVWGEQDTTTPLSDGKLINKMIKKSKLLIIKGAKHSPQLTNMEEVVSGLLEFLG